jgi:thiol-disulfide isomerase/thioredoxin
MDKAQALAKAQGKDILMFFTGSDWCGYCIQLVDEVFSKQEFLDYAKDNFVLVDLDFPSDESIITPEQLAHNEKWRDKFDIQGYPTVILTDSSVNSYALTGYEEGGPKNYSDNLAALKRSKTAIPDLTSKIEKASGLKRAKLLDELLDYANKGASVENSESMLDEVLKLTEGKDQDLYNKYAMLKYEQSFMDAMDELFYAEKPPTCKDFITLHEKFSSIKSGDMMYGLIAQIGDASIGEKNEKQGLAFMDKIIADKSYSLQLRQASQVFKGIIVVNLDKSDKGKERATGFFEKAIKMDPNSEDGKRAQGIIDSMSESDSGN